MLNFKIYYIISATTLCVLVVGSFFASISVGKLDVVTAVISLAVGSIALLPIFRAGGIPGNTRLATRLAVIFAIVTGCMIASGFIGFIETRGGEGPNGEGSPLANMIALAFGAVFGFCPWLLTAFRGLPHWNAHEAS